MEAVNLSQIKQTNFTSKQKSQNEAPKAPEQKKDGAKLLALGAAAVGAIAVAGLAIKGKFNKANGVIPNVKSEIPDIPTSKNKFANTVSNSESDIKIDNKTRQHFVDGELEYTQTRKSFDSKTGNICLYREYAGGYPMIVLKNNKHKVGEVIITDGTSVCVNGNEIKKYHADDIKNFNMKEFLELINNNEACIHRGDGWYPMGTDLEIFKNS